MAKKIAEFNRGTDRKRTSEYQQISAKVARAKKKARKTGDWTRYKALRKDMLKTQAKDQQDPDYRRLHFVRYADDVRHLTHNEILLAEKGGSEERDLRVISSTWS